MDTATSGLRFDEADLPATPAWVAEVPAGIASTEMLFEELFQRLRFPDYFGANWNALEECIRDLSWLPEGPVVIKHHDLPLTGDAGGQQTYLTILREVAERKWAVPGQSLPDVIVVFPPETRSQIVGLLASADDERAR